MSGPSAAPARSFLPACPVWISSAGRPARVTLLLVVIALLSIADLALTLVWANNVGLFESNPIARAIMAVSGPAAIVAWKLATAGPGIVILYRARRRPLAEAAAWGCAAVLAVVGAQWIAYNDAMAGIRDMVPGVELGDDPRFVAMTP